MKGKIACGYLSNNGYDCICTLYGVVLGDIMGYDGKICDKCCACFANSLIDKIAKIIISSKEKEKMVEINVTTNEKEFCERVKNTITREGIHDLLEHLLNETDFFYAPCSTRYHLSVEGGLVEHSLHVDTIFNTLCDTFMPNFPEESRHICALFHDLCKYHCYDPVKKSRKTGRLLPNGKPEWEDYMGYDFVEEFPYGHGEKSVYILQKFIKLTDDEAMAIRWHMGFSDSTFKGGQQSVSNAMKLYPVIALLHSADIIATSKEES